MPAPKGHAAYNKKGEGGKPKVHTDEFIEAEAEAFLAWMDKPGSLYYKKFALERGYHPQRLTEWAQKNEKFADVYRYSQAWQESKLVEGGLKNAFNAGFTKFVMSNTCGWREKPEEQTTHNNTYYVNYGNQE